MSNEINVIAALRDVFGRHTNQTIAAVQELMDAAAEASREDPSLWRLRRALERAQGKQL